MINTSDHKIVGFIGNPYRAYINHPLADEMSYFYEPYDDGSMEVAFFKGDEWVNTAVPELSLWAEDDFGVSRVYRFVPKEVVYTFLVKFEKALDNERSNPVDSP